MTAHLAQKKAIDFMLRSLKETIRDEVDAVAEFDSETQEMYDALAHEDFAYWMEHKNSHLTLTDEPF